MILWIGLRNLRVRFVATAITVLVVAAATAIALVVPTILRQVDRGATEAVQVFDLLVTAKGSPSQAVLSSLFYLDVPIGNMPYERYRALAEDPRTARAVPLGFGDHHRGFPLVGTNAEFFELRLRRDGPPYFRVARGATFDGPFEAVIGAQVALTTGLSLGDTFKTTHGLAMGAGGHHDDDHGHASGPADDHQDQAVLDASHPCAHLIAGPSRAVAGDGAQVLAGQHIRFDVTLTPDETGHAGRLRYRIEGDDALLLVFDADVEVEVLDEAGEVVTFRRYTAEAITGCDPAVLALVIEEGAGVLEIVLRGAPSELVRVVVEVLDHEHDHHHDHDHHGHDHDDGHVHDEDYLVVGVLEPTGGPVDRAILVDIASLWLVHGQLSPTNRGVTAVLFTAHRPVDYYAVAQEIDATPDTQAVFTGAVFAQMRAFVAQGQLAYAALSTLVLLLAALTVWLNVYAGALDRRRSIALLRALGSRRPLVFALVLLETALTIAIGVALGLLLAYALTSVGANLLGSVLGFVLPPPAFDAATLGRVALLVPLGLLAALGPALQAVREPPLRYL